MIRYGQAVTRIGPGVGVLDEDLLAFHVAEHALVQRLEPPRVNRPVDLAPPHLVFARRLADDELVVGRAPRVLAGAAHERAVDRDERLAPADRLLVQRRHTEVPGHARHVVDAVRLEAGCLLPLCHPVLAPPSYEQAHVSGAVAVGPTIDWYWGEQREVNAGIGVATDGRPAGGAAVYCAAMTCRNASTTAGIELGVAAARQFEHRIARRKGVAKDPWPSHRVVGIGQADDAGTERDVLGSQPAWIPEAVHALVHVPDDLAAGRQERDLRGQVGGNGRVQADEHLLFRVQRRRFAQNRFRHDEFAEVVQQGRVFDQDEIGLVHAEDASHAQRECRDAVAVRVGVPIAERQHRQHGVEFLVAVHVQGADGVGQAKAADFELLFERLAPAPGVPCRSMPFEAAQHGFSEAVPAERLGQVVDDALPQALDGGSDILNAGRHDDGGFGVSLTDPLGEPQPVVSRHADVAQGDGRRRRRLEASERLLGVGCRHHGVAACLEPARHQVAHAVFVLHHEHTARRTLRSSGGRGDRNIVRGFHIQTSTSTSVPWRRAIVTDRSRRSSRR